MDKKDLGEVVSIAASSSLNPWSMNMFIEEVLNPIAHCFVVKMRKVSKHPLVGFICFRNIEDESELLNICVHPQYRQLGVGKILMQFYIGFCSKMKIKTFYLEVDSLNQSATHLYRSFSYQPVGIRKKFYRGKFDALLMMKKD
jgi:ribosomal-protein-alanine N-acetyltransferase